MAQDILQTQSMVVGPWTLILESQSATLATIFPRRPGTCTSLRIRRIVLPRRVSLARPPLHASRTRDTMLNQIVSTRALMFLLRQDGVTSRRSPLRKLARVNSLTLDRRCAETMQSKLPLSNHRQWSRTRVLHILRQIILQPLRCALLLIIARLRASPRKAAR